jgi:hypothetical protein
MKALLIGLALAMGASSSWALDNASPPAAKTNAERLDCIWRDAPTVENGALTNEQARRIEGLMNQCGVTAANGKIVGAYLAARRAVDDVRGRVAARDPDAPARLMRTLTMFTPQDRDAVYSGIMSGASGPSAVPEKDHVRAALEAARIPKDDSAAVQDAYMFLMCSLAIEVLAAHVEAG